MREVVHTDLLYYASTEDQLSRFDACFFCRAMWARVKGTTENALLCLPFKTAYMFRPGAIQPLHGVRSKTAAYRVRYSLYQAR